MTAIDLPESHAYPPQALHDYAVLADGERAALVGPRGEVCWLCAPRWHDEAVFATLIGGGGAYAVTPEDRFVPGGHYEEGTLIWRSRWVTQHSIVECREALAYPGDPDRLVLLRRVEALEGPARLRVVLHPLAGYGAEPLHAPHRDEHGVWTARVGDLHLRWTGGAEARLTDAPADTDEAADPATGAGSRRATRLVLALRLDPGQHHDFVLEIGRTPPAGPPPEPDAAWDRTARAWREAVPALDATVAAGDARQSYAVLRGMTGASGGMIAAATTSLPERAEEGRNYDYRYVWIRDQCYAGQAAAAAGEYPLLDAAVRFIGARLHEDGPRLSPAYTVDGGPVPDQRELDLAGYPGGYDRIGNRVNRQFQLDAFGEALLLFAAAARAGRLEGDGWKAVDIAADAVARRWREPDAGIWELEPRVWTHSRLICSAGLRAMAGAAPRGPRARRWTELADTLLAAATATCLHPDGHWQRAADDAGLDAALLLPALRGGVPADDPRTHATLRAYQDRLTDHHYAYRFRHDDRPLAAAEGAFVLCGFAVALAEHQQGREVEAFRWFERNRAACGAAGLYAEEFDITQRQLRGNLPQSFVHAMMLECAARLAGTGGVPERPTSSRGPRG
ncbi:glycoside hydrolase [Streptomyces sp. Ru73]|uniref:glycoside hydrolase family 15 protein n=1 Tax=Streptomyces sp. Ru73 TaxID=2080748 RepID=UPI000CDDCF46|nr:glycoside hydrolase family 15 protein [Streptomyces sp. Ru73]POX39347.1 glycoside hydrolase [Streptomyces sp. Ru73]